DREIETARVARAQGRVTRGYEGVLRDVGSGRKLSGRKPGRAAHGVRGLGERTFRESIRSFPARGVTVRRGRGQPVTGRERIHAREIRSRVEKLMLLPLVS